MQPIKPPSIINNGIAVFAPASERIKVPSLISIEIYYEVNNPLFSWLNCSTEKVKIWDKTQSQVPSGTLFIYETPGDLTLGFYTIKIINTTAVRSQTSGQILVGINSPTPRLIIGLPYSIYPPIDLS